MTRSREPWMLTQSEFIGPAIISEKFAIDGRADFDYATLWEYAADIEDLSAGIQFCRLGYCGIELIDFHPECTVVLFSPDGLPCGFYMDSQLWIDPEHRGKGLGTDLILAAADLLGGTPTRNTQGLGFSAAGHAAHVRAHRFAVEKAIAAGKTVPDAVLRDYPEFMSSKMRPG